jgi:hypothetical protein
MYEIVKVITNKVGQFIIGEPNKKRVGNEKELQDELDKLRIELSNNKS